MVSEIDLLTGQTGPATKPATLHRTRWLFQSQVLDATVKESSHEEEPRFTAGR